jgi:mono/diheme cytochrome c family protein
MPSTILRRGGVLSLVAAALTTITLTACGGDSSSNDTGTSSATSPPAAGASTAATTESGGASAGADGAKIFASAGCASCHTLKAADSNGQVGPNLDDLKPDEATVEKQVTNGGGGMPAFKDSLSPEEIKAVSTYVADNAGT